MTELEKVNKARLKKNPNAVLFCEECDLEKKEFCPKCAEKMRNRLDDFLDEDEDSFEINLEETIPKTRKYPKKKKVDESVTDFVEENKMEGKENE